MKRTLSAVALAAITLSSASVNAQNPQPSFQDSAPVQTAPATTETVIVKQNFPKPSFQDNAEVAGAAVVIERADDAATPVAHSAAPLPSFNG